MKRVQVSKRLLKSYGPIFAVLGTPDELFSSEHGVPNPEMYENARTKVRDIFDAVDAAARSMGLTDLGTPKKFTKRRQPATMLWNADAWAEMDRIPKRPRHESDPTNAWASGVLVWSDPLRTRCLLVGTDYDGMMPDEILTWGEDAERCLSIVEAALDDDRLWE